MCEHLGEKIRCGTISNQSTKSLFCLSTEQQITNCRVKFPKGPILSLLSGMLNRKKNKIELDARKLAAETIWLDDSVQPGPFLLSIKLTCLLFFLSLNIAEKMSWAIRSAAQFVNHNKKTLDKSCIAASR